jgi:thiol-disulfide isomerase/thioredoxin
VWGICWEDRGIDPDYVEVGPYCDAVGDIGQNVFWFDVDSAVHEFAHDFYGQYPAILFVVSAAWCGPCAAEAATLPGLQTEYGAENLAILQLLTEGETTGSDITPEIVQAWQDTNMGGAQLAGGSLAPTWINYIENPSSFTIPLSIVIDGATMEIMAMGTEIDTAAIDALVP